MGGQRSRGKSRDGPSKASTQSGERPYRSSWVDSLSAWVGHLPGPDWLFYAVLALGLFLPTGVWLIQLIVQRLLG